VRRLEQIAATDDADEQASERIADHRQPLDQ
jgi:hypothetical protein